MTDTVVNASVSAALSSPQFRTRDEKISRLATLPDNDYIILINLNIAAFAACAKEVGFPFFNHLLSDYESNRFRADATKNLLDIASDSVEKHANQIVEAISGQGKAEILFTFRNARSGILKDAGDGILVVSYSGGKEIRSLSGKDLSATPSPYFLPAFTTSLPVPVKRSRHTPSSGAIATLLRDTYRSQPGFCSGLDICDTLELNFG